MNDFEGREQDELRSGLRGLADQQVPVPAPVREVVERGRRRRRVRVAGAVTAVVACAVVAGVLSGTQSAPDERRPAPAAAEPTASATSAEPTVSAAASESASAPALAAAPVRREVDPAGPPAQPGSPVLGQAYPFDWGVHCGARYLWFSGRIWQAQGEVSLPPGLPGVHGPNSAPLVVPGYVTVTGADTARFEAPGYLREPAALRAVADAPLCA
ncbi:hypothetical protein [Kitasatospora purpeofusca]|uniref:hypothetical protein n=1 Tax=Kitasatospora purpeofusca TaxID=67352 RepID=UPI0036635A56